MSVSEMLSRWTLPTFGVKAPVGEASPLDPEDHARTRGVLDAVGYGKNAGGGAPGVLADLREFQKDNGLEVDGLMNPGGPTERALAGVYGRIAAQDAPIVPSGDTVDRRLRSLMEDPRYPSDPRLSKFVSNQFAKAYPGEVAFGPTGRMERPRAAIAPEEVSPFDPGNVLSGARRASAAVPARLTLAQRQAARHGAPREAAPIDLLAATGLTEDDIAVPPPEVAAAREAPFRTAREKREAMAEWERGLLPGFAGGDQKAFEAAARRVRDLRDKDPDSYAMLSRETRMVFEGYEKAREAYAPIMKKSYELGLGSEEDLKARYAREAFEVAMHHGALRNAGSAVAEPLNEAMGRIGQAFELLSTGRIDAAKYDRMLEDIRSGVPAGYRNSPVYGQIRDATALAVEIAKHTPIGGVPGKLADVGEIADELARTGSSSPQQLAGAAIYILSSDMMAGGLRKAGGAAMGAAAKQGYRAKMPKWFRWGAEYVADEAGDALGRAGVKGGIRPGQDYQKSQ